jgi:sec-independent protein translocase protein TatA
MSQRPTIESEATVGLENPLHIAIVLIVVLMVFGAKRLPEMGRGLGEGMRGFKSALTGESHHEPELHVQHLTATAEQPMATSSSTPATTSGNTEERAPEPVA